MIQEQTQSLYLTASSGEVFTNPFFLLATCFAVKPSPVAPEIPLEGGRSVEVWISPDPMRQYSSPYSYSPNPTNTVDPDGMKDRMFADDFIGPLEEGDYRVRDYWAQENPAHMFWRERADWMWEQYNRSNGNVYGLLLAKLTSAIADRVPETNHDALMAGVVGMAGGTKPPPGYTVVKGFFPNGQKVFTDGKYFISKDVGTRGKSHNGGVWKMAKSPKDLFSKETRIGTFDADMKKIGP